ncbi:hypothetical protein LBMAG53_18850 [Planctomycetota bacterium]|nr:hypothetical protein LBMAG53_18850 [Planctomycetota bacterium]
MLKARVSAAMLLGTVLAMTGCIRVDPGELAGQRFTMITQPQRIAGWDATCRLEFGPAVVSGINPSLVIDRPDLALGDQIANIGGAALGNVPWRIALNLRFVPQPEK